MSPLIKKYKKNTPHVTPLWDTSDRAISFNDIHDDFLKPGVILYEAPFDHVWMGIFEPKVYDRKTLWNRLHNSDKIAQVIDNWINGVELTPIFLVKHGKVNLGLVSDGKHRLTVARYMGCESIPFMVSRKDDSWIQSAISSAKILRSY